MELKTQLHNTQVRVADYVEQYFARALDTDETIKSATLYSINNGGKRLRPFLVYATGQMLGADIKDLDVVAAAIECIHSYSLVHDDLPAMDDDELRRGKPTCHIAFNEAHAILAGDALQTIAFELLSGHTFKVPATTQVKMLYTLAKASGIEGMIGGQALDLAGTNTTVTLAELERIHKLKTGALLSAAIELGALCALNVEASTHQALQRYAKNVGLAFQVQDDILDIEGDTQSLGKPQGSDIENNKSTYPALLGLEGAKSKAQSLIDEAILALEDIKEDTTILANLAHYIIERNY
ncbi:Farnesyl diphosphate synthase [Pseudoalteromonas holothuriae]|uniref:Farnesyl diphosphate synthase n=1 Tax=Pseudoalteromonas holothuriae TaxID=2963714 RepID=A0A9W4QQQ8_9GAMM|nr:MULTISPECIES: farnesyl diphosphate synthase [unclassified Pseudoalteromonas]CAH9049489.1 Farnesyl diphosphate synthase [Pseudoalteromonas sp. CIP111854]CAH9055706.1 Farnesyl diphosphate synthase [Pseudoalteromonas sp. CIP111951]